MEPGSIPPLPLCVPTTSPPTPHVLMFPFPLQGHVSPMLKLAELLGLAGLNITFLNYERIHGDLLKHADVEARFSSYQGFEFKFIPDSLTTDAQQCNDMTELLAEKMKALFFSKPIFEKILIDSKPPFSCIIGDPVLTFVKDVATKLRIPYIQFYPASACFYLTTLYVHRMVEAGELPIKGKEDMDRLITTVPGMEAFLRCRDLPSFCRVSDPTDPKFQIIFQEKQAPKALIINTFEDLEAPILSEVRTHSPETYVVGPLHELLERKLGCTVMQQSFSLSNSLQKEDRSCISWLDNQPSKSVLYISFGSLAFVTRDQLMELWHGIVNSKKSYLWVLRPDSITNEDGDPVKIPEDLQVGPKECGYIVNWAPQEEVLSHKAIGGFLTHSGWNSTLESIVAGVPMICWPCLGDQQVNSRFVSEVWTLGFDMKDVCDRGIVEKMVNDLMVDQREQFVKSAAKMAELARKSVTEGGSSSWYLDRLIEDIKLMSTKNTYEEQRIDL